MSKNQEETLLTTLRKRARRIEERTNRTPSSSQQEVSSSTISSSVNFKPQSSLFDEQIVNVDKDSSVQDETINSTSETAYKLAETKIKIQRLEKDIRFALTCITQIKEELVNVKKSRVEIVIKN